MSWRGRAVVGRTGRRHPHVHGRGKGVRGGGGASSQSPITKWHLEMCCIEAIARDSLPFWASMISKENFFRSHAPNSSWLVS